jgi:hypothetical protein
MAVALATALFWMSRLFAQEEKEITLRCVSAVTKGGSPLKLEGTAPLPDRTVLRLSLYRVEERGAEGRLVPEMSEIGVVLMGVKFKRIRFDRWVGKPGIYRAVVEVVDEDQNPAIAETTRKLVVRKYTFDFAVWGDDLALRLGPGLVEVDELAEQALGIVGRFAATAVSTESLTEATPELEREVGDLLREIDRCEARPLYPAAIQEIKASLRFLNGNASALTVTEDGKLLLRLGELTRGAVKAERLIDFDFEKLKARVKEAVPLAGREFALWVLKEFKRAGIREGLLECVREQAEHAGVSVFAERLEKLTTADVDLLELEKEIRGEGEEKP